jgi:bifunctional UDP-N-acetylglucosamine pyrophosphorylase/glucosamine-1-phosphate N-acetyltransferase
MTKSDLSVIILAAGKGTRMKSSIPKSMHKIAGRQMTNLVIDTARQLNPLNICLVISENMADFTDKIKEQYDDLDIDFTFQKERLGTGDAVKIAINSLKQIGKKVLILYADTPLLTLETLQKMVDDLAVARNNTVCVLGFNCLSDNKYGRLVVEEGGLQKIVEFKDASAKERDIILCNSGVVAVDGDKVKALLSLITNNNASAEYYLTDIIAIAKNQGLECGFIKVSEEEVMGINSRIDLAKAEKIKQNQLREKFMAAGVTLLDPNSVYFAFDTVIANDVTIHPQVFFGSEVEIESNVQIRSFSHIQGAKIKSEVIIGPFARIRPGSIINQKAQIGNFVEVKKSNIKQGAKINHLSYIGDSQIGKDSNIGAGTITCNYDGYQKFKTTIGENVFIGSNSSLIAPVTIGNNAVIGAGSVISKDVKDEDLAVCRTKQVNLDQGGKSYHQRKKKNKK